MEESLVQYLLLNADGSVVCYGVVATVAERAAGPCSMTTI